MTDATDEAPDDWSGLNLMDVVRRLSGQPQAQPSDALAQLQALFAQAPPAQPTRTGLFGGGYAEYMAGQPLTPAAPITAADTSIQPAAPIAIAPGDLVAQPSRLDLVPQVAQPGDGISTLVGTSDPTAVGAFMAANGLNSSNITAGQSYLVPQIGAPVPAGATQLGQATLNSDNQRLAAVRGAQAARAAQPQPQPHDLIPQSYGPSPFTPFASLGQSVPGGAPSLGAGPVVQQPSRLATAAGVASNLDQAMTDGQGFANCLGGAIPRAFETASNGASLLDAGLGYLKDVRSGVPPDEAFVNNAAKGLASGVFVPAGIATGVAAGTAIPVAGETGVPQAILGGLGAAWGGKAADATGDLVTSAYRGVKHAFEEDWGIAPAPTRGR